MGDLKRTTKRLLSLFLALIMTFGLLPTAVWAEDPATPGSSAAAPGSSVETPALITYEKSTNYKPAGVKVIESAGQYDVTFEPLVCFENVNDTFVYEQGKIPIEIGFMIGTNSTAPVTLSEYTVTVQQVTASGGAVEGASQHAEGPEESLSSNNNVVVHGVELNAVPLEDNMLRLRFTVEKGGAEGAEGAEVGRVYVGITGIEVTDVPSYTIHFKSELTGARGLPATAQTSNGSTYIVPAKYTPKLDGYTFEGWQVTGENAEVNGNVVSNITSDITLTATWRNEETQPETTHTVTYHENGTGVYNMPAARTLKSGETLTEPQVRPQRDGYQFGGWCTDEACNTEYAFGNTLSADLNLFAKWNVDQVTVTFNAIAGDAGVSYTPGTDNDKVNKGSSVRFSLTLKEGYDPATLTVKANKDVLAPESVTGQTYSYVFTANANTTVSVSSPSKLTYPVMMPVGHFDAAITAVTGTGSSKPNDASAVIEYGEGYTFTIAPNPGYQVSVYVNGVKQTGDGTYTVTDVTSAQKVEVVESEIPNCSVTFIVPLTGQSFTQTVARDRTANRPGVDPEREGYVFGNWYTADEYKKPNGTPFDFNGAITADTVLYGKFKAKTYNITYDQNCAGNTVTNIPPSQTKTHGIAAQLSQEKPTRTGYEFLGWSTTSGEEAMASYQPGDMYSVDANVMFYAVWKQKTYTVTLPTGSGYSISTTQSTTVNYDGDFIFDVIVDRAYTANDPTVTVKDASSQTSQPLTAAHTVERDGSFRYTFQISNIRADKVVSVQVWQNLVYTVSFMTGDTLYQTQRVGYGERAAKPADPAVEGYEFGGWYQDEAFENVWNFTDSMREDGATINADTVTSDKTLYAKLEAIQPTVSWPQTPTGYTLTVTNPTNLTNGKKVAYGEELRFTITVSSGYDASNMQVGFNGSQLSPTEINDGVYSFVVPAVKEKTNRITVVGVVRKTITVTYNDNGGYGGPMQQTLNAYVADANDNGKLSEVKPSRTGYEFLGWAKTNDRTTAEYLAGAANVFAQDTILYAVWSAKETGVTLETDVDAQYEGENVRLTATITSGAANITSGSVQFYRTTDDLADTNPKWELLGSEIVSGGTAVFTAATSDYRRSGSNQDSYKAVFIPDEGAGYSKKTSDVQAVVVKSAAISWQLTAEADTVKVANANRTLNVYNVDDNGKQGARAEGNKMTAGQQYILELPKVFALDTQDNALNVKQDYRVIWQFRNDKGVWEDYTDAGSGDTMLVDAAYSKYVFRAIVMPVGQPTSHFTKSASYDENGALAADYVQTGLVTLPTEAVGIQGTATALSVTNTKNVDGKTAQFEGQTVTLTASITAADAKVTEGEVYFYKNYDAETKTGTQIGIASVRSDGTAVLDAVMSDYSAAGKSDVFTAVYQGTGTYDKSTSSSMSVLIRSTAIVWTNEQSRILLVKDAKGADATKMVTGNTYTLSLKPNAVSEEGQNAVQLAAGRDYFVRWYQVDANGVVTQLGDTDADSIKVTPASENMRYYAEVYPKETSDYTDAYQNNAYTNCLTSADTDHTRLAPTVTTISFTDVLTDAAKTPNFSQYEEKTITITAKVVEAELNAAAAKNPEVVVKSGTVSFYVVTDETGTYQKIGEASVSNGQASMPYRLPTFALGDALKNIEYFFAVYNDTANTYSSSNTTGLTEIAPSPEAGLPGAISETNEAVQILSTTISWQLTADNAVVINGRKLRIYEGNGTTGRSVDAMTAGSTYTLELPGVYALDHADAENENEKLTVNEDYVVVWQYREFGASDWQTYTGQGTGNTALITPQYSEYQFRAVVTPIYDNESLTGYKNAADYNAAGKVTGKVKELYTDPTNETNLQKTATALTITGAENEGSVKIAGADVPTGLAQFERKTVTLQATVTDTTTNEGVLSGYVKFYRYVDETGTNDVLLNTTQVAVDEHGVATFEAEIAAWNTGKTVQKNVDRFYAVYEKNATYDSSASYTPAEDEAAAVGELKDVYIKSTAIRTPVIDSKLEGSNGKKATTYQDNLIGLLAGVEHTFTLRTGNQAKDWSVVALDGREVNAKNYTIQWITKTGDNETVSDVTGPVFTTSNNKNGDEIYVRLNPAGDMTTGADSMKAIIGDKQDVLLTVEAVDAIAATTVDREKGQYPDVYQLGEMELKATVEAAGKDATMLPSGVVVFYYADGQSFVELGQAELAKDTDGKMRASIKTDKLPVDAQTNTKRDVVVCAAYLGDNTFKTSRNVGADKKITSADVTDNSKKYVSSETVTVYSSVVFNCTDENKTTACAERGIHISVTDGAFQAHETNVELSLSDVYTLDQSLEDETLRKAVAKLDPNKDYTVTWQKLNGATYITDGDYKDAVGWVNVEGTGTKITLQEVEQNTAYRAVITVANPATPIVKGSFNLVQQNVTGRQVYYSNVLMPSEGQATVSVAINTNAHGDNKEGITEGETVTANVFVSGAVNAVPNANVTVTVTADAAKGNTFEYSETLTSKNTVNGWNAFDWSTEGVAPGFYTMRVTATSNTGYETQTITRSLIVRESSYSFTAGNTNPTYNGRTQGLEVSLNSFSFNGTGIQEAAEKSWNVKYYDKETKELVEPTQAGEYTAHVTLPASAYWTEWTQDFDFTIEKRKVSVADAVAQTKVYDGSQNVNLVEVILNDAETEQGDDATGWLANGKNTGVINGDSLYATATGTLMNGANAGWQSFQVTDVTLCGDDEKNYQWSGNVYTEKIYVNRSQVYGETATLQLKQGDSFPAEQVISMIDQSGKPVDYRLTFYYHSDTEIRVTKDLTKLGLYTVVATPDQTNYKSGTTMQFEVVEGETKIGQLETPKPSTLIYLSDTAEVYKPAGMTGVTAKNADGDKVDVYYQSGSGWGAENAVPTTAGRYLVKAVDEATGDVAYGIYTIVKARPQIDFDAATHLTYNSTPQAGYTGTPSVQENAETYFTYAGETAIGQNVPSNGNVDEQAPVDAGTYTVTLHTNETQNYTAHEISKTFTIAKRDLTITADSWVSTQYGAFPDMTATYKGLAAETDDHSPDTSLRDVQIAPEFLYNPGNGYTNDSLDQVGMITVRPVDALARNYNVTPIDGQYTKQNTEANPNLAIHGLPQSGTGRTVVYYGDSIQLYPYGYYDKLSNGSSVLSWSATPDAAGFKGTVSISNEGLLTVNGVGTFTVTLTRGVDTKMLTTTQTVEALKKELKVSVPDQDKVYNGGMQTYSGAVTAYDELHAAVKAATTTPANNERKDVGTQITTSRIADGSSYYQSYVYGGKYTINDKEATVEPKGDTNVYGTFRTAANPAYEATDIKAVYNVNTVSQTDSYDRLDENETGYEILVAGTEDMNYNVRYVTAGNAETSKVEAFNGQQFKSKTVKFRNDATVYGETSNTLTWELVNARTSTRGSRQYTDNLADFELPETFVYQVKDMCTGNAVQYKAANRTTTAPANGEVQYNQAVLEDPRTAVKSAEDPANYTLFFNSSDVKNAGGQNYTLTDGKTGNKETTTGALTAGSLGYSGGSEDKEALGENFVEGSANIAQRPIRLTTDTSKGNVQLYWKLPQSQLYTALLNVLTAEANSEGRGLAKGHTIRDLDLKMTISGQSIDPNDETNALKLPTGKVTVEVTVGDTNYVLEGGKFTFEVVLHAIQIEATYTTKTATGFTVLIKVHEEKGKVQPLTGSQPGLSYAILRKVDGAFDGVVYARGGLTYQNRTATDRFGDTCGVYTATYSSLPAIGGTYFIQMYEYGVALKTNER